MSNSFILSVITKFIYFVRDVYMNSLLHKLFCKFDNCLKNLSINSSFVKLLIRKDNSQIFPSSKLFAIMNGLLHVAQKSNSHARKWITNSWFMLNVNLFITSFKNSPMRIISAFGVAFLASCITLEVIFRANSFSSIMLKLALLLILIAFSKVEQSLVEIVYESKFYKLFKFIMNHES